MESNERLRQLENDFKNAVDMMGRLSETVRSMAKKEKPVKDEDMHRKLDKLLETQSQLRDDVDNFRKEFYVKLAVLEQKQVKEKKEVSKYEIPETVLDTVQKNINDLVAKLDSVKESNVGGQKSKCDKIKEELKREISRVSEHRNQMISVLEQQKNRYTSELNEFKQNSDASLCKIERKVDVLLGPDYFCPNYHCKDPLPKYPLTEDGVSVICNNCGMQYVRGELKQGCKWMFIQCSDQRTYRGTTESTLRHFQQFPHNKSAGGHEKCQVCRCSGTTADANNWIALPSKK